MKKFVSFFLFLVLLILIIPAFALIGNPATKENGIKSDNLSKKDLQENNFYLILNDATGEVMRLTPADYIKGVVAAEMPVDFHTEALKAQAVAAHTYALRQIDEELSQPVPTPALNGGYLSTDYTKFQAYLSKEELKTRWGKDFDLNYQKLSDAVDSVINEVLTYESAPIAAAFHAISSGKTESAKNVWGGDIQYLSPVESQGDELSPSFENKVILKDTEVSHAFLQRYPEIKFNEDRTKWFEVKSKSDSGSILELKVGTIVTTGKEARELLNLKSANFTVVYADNNFTFTTSGYGHGVGMSQYGADYMARQGADYKEILLHYYSGVTLEELPE